MKKIWKWYNSLSNRIRNSVTISVTTVGLISTIMSVIGVTLRDLTDNISINLVIIVVGFMTICLLVYWIIGLIYRDTVSFKIRSMSIEIFVGNIFEESGFKVIGCDTHFDTRVDDIIVSKTSLHGQVILNHGKKDEIEAAVDKKAKSLGLQKNEAGLYDFPLGTVIRYDSSQDHQTYLMLAMTEIRNINGQYKAYTSMSKFEYMLRTMWNEIDGVYAYNDVVLPLLGTGISRFEGGGKNKEVLLRCMLCTLNSSGIDLTSKIKVVIYGDAKDISLYEYKEMFRTI